MCVAEVSTITDVRITDPRVCLSLPHSPYKNVEILHVQLLMSSILLEHHMGLHLCETMEEMTKKNDRSRSFLNIGG